jgi:hypothetical protein
LFRLAEKNLAPFDPRRHDLDVAKFRKMLARYCRAIDAVLGKNPWRPDNAPKVSLL